jgi:ABC-type multidrug transport system permease subunit
LAGYLILLIFAYSFSWVMAMMGLLAPGPEVVNNAAFIVIFPLTFVANTFVPIVTLPGPLRTFAEWNPVSSVTQAARELFGNIAPNTPAPGWPLQHPVTYTLMWSVGILVVFVPLATRQFRRSVSR